MEKYFVPVQNHSEDEVKPRRHHHPVPHHHHHQHQDRETLSYPMLADNDKSQGHHHHHHHGHPLQDDRGHHQRHQHPHHQQPQHLHEADETSEHRTSVTLSRASSSSLSSSSSSSSSWSSETSLNDPISLKHASRPLHSMSCSNILEARGKFPEDDAEPTVYAAVKHGRPVGGSPEGPRQAQGGIPRQAPDYSQLHRGHSRSTEGLLQTHGSERGAARKPPHREHGALYKSASLSRSLAFNEEIMLGAGPKRAVSSIHLPSKGILKSREARPDIRKAKSMEVLSPRLPAGGQARGRGKGVDLQAQRDAARQKMVTGKLQFSAFLDEITKQVISPSRLNTLGVNTKTPGHASAPAPAPTLAAPKTQPQLPLKKHAEGQGVEKMPPTKQQAPQGKPSNASHPRSKKISHPSKILYSTKNHTRPGSPPQQHPGHLYPPASHKDRPLSQAEFHGPVGDRQGRYGPLLTDGTSTSPELSQHPPKHRQHKHQSHRSSPPQPQQPHPIPGNPGRMHSPPPGPGPNTESTSSKSDSSRNRDASTASPSFEQSDRDSRAAHRGRPKAHRASMCDNDQVQVLQEENTELHQNLCQTVVCIETLEAELQRTREDLRHTKEKLKRLQETHTGTQNTNNLLGEKLHSAAESIGSERKFLIQRIGQLTTELEEAHSTISSLENINVPSLIKDLLEKHSGEALQKLLLTATPTSQSTATHQSLSPKVEEMPSDRSGAGLRGLGAGQQRVTAFMPWKQQEEEDDGTMDHPPSDPQGPSPPFCVADISLAIYRKMATSQAGGQPWPAGYQALQPSPASQHHSDSPPNPYHVGAEVVGVGGESHCVPAVRGGAGGAEHGAVVDMSYLTAQNILDDFMHQLQHPEEGGRGRGHGVDLGRGGE